MASWLLISVHGFNNTRAILGILAFLLLSFLRIVAMEGRPGMWFVDKGVVECRVGSDRVPLLPLASRLSLGLLFGFNAPLTVVLGRVFSDLVPVS